MTYPPGTVFDFTAGAPGVVVKLGWPGYVASIPSNEQCELFEADADDGK